MKFISRITKNNVVELYDDMDNMYLIDNKDLEIIEKSFCSIYPVARGYIQGRLIGDHKKIGPTTVHRWLMGLRKGDPREAHHLNENKRDNRRSNLEIKTILEHSRIHHKKFNLSFRVNGGTILNLENVVQNYGLTKEEFLERALVAALEKCKNDMSGSSEIS